MAWVNPETGAVESDGCDWRKPYVPFERRLTPAQRKKLEKEMLKMRSRVQRRIKRRAFFDRVFGGHWEWRGAR
jgi:hypothetical protein